MVLILTLSSNMASTEFITLGKEKIFLHTIDIIALVNNVYLM